MIGMIHSTFIYNDLIPLGKVIRQNKPLKLISYSTVFVCVFLYQNFLKFQMGGSPVSSLSNFSGSGAEDFKEDPFKGKDPFSNNQPEVDPFQNEDPFKNAGTPDDPFKGSE